MNVLVLLIPVSLILGGAGVAAFIWTLKSRQYEDPDGHAARILIDESEDVSMRAKPAAETPGARA